MFSGIKCFFAHQQALGRTQDLCLAPLPRNREQRPPRIYTKDEIRALLEGAVVCQSTSFSCDAETLRIALLLLYATGATATEVLRLRVSDLDLQRRIIGLGSSATKRWIPVAVPLAKLLRRVIGGKRADDVLLCNRHGSPLSRAYLGARFQRLTQQVKTGNDIGGKPPRLQDFRYTFAVHRIESWIQQGADLNVLLPALSTYMGYADLRKAEEFLALTPERFREDLEKLSPAKHRRTWNDDPRLLAFLTRL
ncbi:tyrosine-type recombinase/integrase [Terriglobus aquaticus]|uniref:Tyrosine-type recombinase/integrase n=1 Tax=Terriglobus aquaticus TaxID=940139 RepID=A0ABW9KGP7_9BACT